MMKLFIGEDESGPETRNMCFADPGGGEFFQMSYLCTPEASLGLHEKTLQRYTPHDLAAMTERELAKLGVYPTAMYYERNGQVRAREIEVSVIRIKNSQEGMAA